MQISEPKKTKTIIYKNKAGCQKSELRLKIEAMKVGEFIEVTDKSNTIPRAVTKQLSMAVQSIQRTKDFKLRGVDYTVRTVSLTQANIYCIKKENK